MSYPAATFDCNGDFTTLHNFKPSGIIDFSASNVSYIKVNAAHGLRINDSADTKNLVIITDDGRLQIPALIGSGKRSLSVDANGYLCV